ncbi:MAG: hypothetical protein M3464_05225 [Chloroflexota bacterium]|nr:hypothetical protein [Chloroflexota bacterium]
MDGATLPLPGEPVTLKTATRTLLEQAPAVGLATVAGGEWIAAPLWVGWQRALSGRGVDWPDFLTIVVGYQNELRLWVMGERPWDQCIAGLAGRILRRSGQPRNQGESRDDWSVALARIGLTQTADLGSLDHAIQRLGLDYTVTIAEGDDVRSATGASAIVWSGGKRRDPEVPFGEARSAASSAAALAEALARFLIKDPGYPVP